MTATMNGAAVLTEFTDEGTDSVQSLIVGRAIAGINAFR